MSGRPAPRLHVQDDLGDGQVTLSAEHARYLGSVLRLKPGDTVRLFNGRDGEWAYRVQELSKRAGTAEPAEKLRDQPSGPAGPRLLFAPVKRTQTEFLVQKATELGVGCLSPVITERTNRDQVRIDRLQLIAAEAAEQSERLDLPRVEEPKKLIDGLATSACFLFCDEAGDELGKPWGGDQGRAGPLQPDPAATPDAVLIGPEGGFTPDERQRLRADPRAIPISLGPRILRAETAAIVALTLWQQAYGDLA